MKVCNVPGCPTLSDKSKCREHERKADRQRGTSSQRGYSSKGHKDFREQVLTRDELCQCDADCRDHLTPVECFRFANVADHYPLSRQDLVSAGLDPNNPDNGRGLCKPCHDRETARNQPGGWNDRES